VSSAHRCSFAGLGLHGLAVIGLNVIFFGAVAGRNVGLVAGACALPLFTFFWFVLPLMLRTRGMDTRSQSAAGRERRDPG
jgi:hypothetical protein